MAQPICCANMLLKYIRNVVPVIKNEVSDILHNQRIEIGYTLTRVCRDLRWKFESLLDAMNSSLGCFSKRTCESHMGQPLYELVHQA